jgi:hypothetical protein
MSAPNIEYVRAKLAWMRDEHIWPNGLRYLWTDAFGLVLLVSLHRRLGEAHYLDEAEWLVSEVERVYGRPRGIRIGEAPDRDGQYFHYLAMWLFALARLGALKADYRSARPTRRVARAASGAAPADRAARVNEFFETYRAGDEYDREAITHVMACTARFPGDFRHRARDG